MIAYFIFCGGLMKIDRMQSNKMVQYIPPEIVEEIISYVPEYGYFLNTNLHKKSMDLKKGIAPKKSMVSKKTETKNPWSYYCDYYRYCSIFVGIQEDIISGSLVILEQFKKEQWSSNVNDFIYVPNEFYQDALECLHRNLYDLIGHYICKPSEIAEHALMQFGIKNVSRLTLINEETERFELMIDDMSYGPRVLDLYIMMILKDTGNMTAREFRENTEKISDIDYLIEIILVVWNKRHHIHNIVIRMFRDRIGNILKTICRKSHEDSYAEIDLEEIGYDSKEEIEDVRNVYKGEIAEMKYVQRLRETEKGVLYDFDDHYVNTQDIETCIDILNQPIISGSHDRKILQEFRDNILRKILWRVKYKDMKKDVRWLVNMIECLPDE